MQSCACIKILSCTATLQLIYIFLYFFFSEVPIITVNCSSSTTVKEGDYFACECKGTDGNPPADVTWYKDNTKIGDTGNKKAILRFTDVKRGHSGTYSCEAKSGIGNVKNETEIGLIVNCKCTSINNKVLIRHRNI